MNISLLNFWIEFHVVEELKGKRVTNHPLVQLFLLVNLKHMNISSINMNV